MAWSKVTLQVTTPLFNAGYDTGTAQLRVPSLLGAMRFWFRALVGAHVGSDVAALRHWEARVFGKAGDEVPRHGHASPIQWRIPQQPSPTGADAPTDWLPSRGRHWKEHGDDRWLVYLLGQDLGDLGTCSITRPYIAPDVTFELWFRARRHDPEVLRLALAALWVTCAFGGIGARTRRGYGGLRITGFEPNGLDLPTPWDRIPLTARMLPDYHELTALWCPLLDRVTAPDLTPRPVTGTPTYPILSPQPDVTWPRTTDVGVGPIFPTWHQALRHAGQLWRAMRATVDNPAATYLAPKVKTPEWIDTVNGVSDEFALGSLGLPVQFKNGFSAKAMTADGESRRASPVWFRPVHTTQGWRVFSFVFLSRVLPNDGTVTAKLYQIQGQHTLWVKDLAVTQSHLEGFNDIWLYDLTRG